MKQFRLLWAVAIATLLLVVFLTTCPVVVVKAQEPYPPVRIAEPGGDCATGPFIDPDEDGHYRFSLERTAEGCCTSSYWHYCEWPRGEVPSYTAHVEITMHSDATSFAAVGEVAIPYNDILYCRTGQNQGVYDRVCTMTYTRTVGIDNDDTHPTGFQLNGPSYGEIDIWLDGWTHEIVTQTNYCLDGTEVISDPVYLEAGELWASDAISTTWNYLQARYTISNANEPAGRTLAGLATLNGKDWLWGPESNGTIVSVTIPSSIGYDEEPNGPVVELGVRNTYDPFYLVSACIVPYSQTMVPSDCNLVNHSFTEDLPGWSTLVYDYLSTEEDGAISLDGGGTGLASQVVTLTGSFRLEVRARSGGTSSEFRFGGYELGYPFESQAFTETATSEYQIFNGYLYLDGRSNISLVSNDDDLIVDWVCLSGHDTSGLPWKFPIPDCEFPTFDDHPEYSITEIGNWIDWLAQKTGELLKWVVCQIFVALFTIANMILEAIRAIGGFVGSPDWPTLPDEITFDSILEWLRQVYVAFFNWLGLNFSRFRNAIPTVVGWLWDAVLGVIGWIIDSLIGPIFGWLLDQLLAALGIGEDARDAFMILWRDAGIFLQAAWIEAGYEFDSLILLLQETASVFGVLIVGFRGVATGDSELDFGESLGGLAAYLWRGVSFINDVVSFTPLSALNIVALGIITIGLAQWTVKKFVGMLERFS